MIDAVLSGNAPALERLIHYTPAPCVTTQTALGSPPLCRPDEAEGTPVDVVLLAYYEGVWERPDELHLPPLRGALNAVYRTAPDTMPRTEYTAVFSVAMPESPLAFALSMTDEGVTVFLLGCNNRPQDIVSYGRLTDAVIPPR